MNTSNMLFQIQRHSNKYSGTCGKISHGQQQNADRELSSQRVVLQFDGQIETRVHQFSKSFTLLNFSLVSVHPGWSYRYLFK